MQIVDVKIYVPWKPITGKKGEVYWMTKDERYYISRPICSKRGWELSKRNVIDGVTVYTFLRAFSSLKKAKDYVAFTYYNN